MDENRRKSLIQACSVLPDRSILIGHKLVEDAKIEKLKCDILRYFQTLCMKRDFHL